jgi:hypothetical protein
MEQRDLPTAALEMNAGGVSEGLALPGQVTQCTGRLACDELGRGFEVHPLLLWRQRQGFSDRLECRGRVTDADQTTGQLDQASDDLGEVAAGTRQR